MRIAVVNYLNAKPFTDGLWAMHHSRGGVRPQWATPRECLNALCQSRADLGLVPIAGLPKLGEPRSHVLSEWGIGCVGAVKSVLLVGPQPISQWVGWLPDPQSTTSNALAQWLLKHHWKLDIPKLRQAPHAPHGQVLIGDEALRLPPQQDLPLDLGQAWHEATGLGFVFAVWAFAPGYVPLTDDLKAMRPALNNSLANRRKHYAEWAESTGLSLEGVTEYLDHALHNSLTDLHRQGAELFMRLLPEIDGSAPVKLEWLD